MTLAQGDAATAGIGTRKARRSPYQAALQPVVRLDGTVLGHEALLRKVTVEVTVEKVRSVGAELVAAQGTPRGRALDATAVRAALQAWRAHAEPEQDLFLNAPPMVETELADWLSGLGLLAHECQVPLTRVVVELHESQPAEQLRVLRRALEAGRDLGLRFALDDVDAGPRCLSLVRSLAPEVVKLDGALVRGLADRGTAGKVARLAMALAPRRAVLVAEQVERADQVDRLVPLGVTHFQGWLVGLPALGSTPRATGWRWGQAAPA